MEFSIIIPTFNEFENLKRQKHFFKCVDLTHVEIIIADSVESIDDSNRIDEPFEYINTHVSGRAKQMNVAAKMAQGKYLIFLHADVLPPPSFLDDINECIQAGFKFGFFAYSFNPSSPMLNINAFFTKFDGIFAGGGDQIHFIERQLFYALKGYNEKFCIMEDFEFIQRIKSNKIKYTIIQSKAQVSSRKYVQNSWLKVNVVNLIAFILFKLAVGPNYIKKIYTNLITT